MFDHNSIIELNLGINNIYYNTYPDFQDFDLHRLIGKYPVKDRIIGPNVWSLSIKREALFILLYDLKCKVLSYPYVTFDVEWTACEEPDMTLDNMAETKLYIPKIFMNDLDFLPTEKDSYTDDQQILTLLDLSNKFVRFKLFFEQSFVNRVYNYGFSSDNSFVRIENSKLSNMFCTNYPGNILKTFDMVSSCFGHSFVISKGSRIQMIDYFTDPFVKSKDQKPYSKTDLISSPPYHP